MDGGAVAAMRVSGGGKVPSPLLSSTETVLESKLATARSGLPSPLKSPTATETGLAPATKKVGSASRRPSALITGIEVLLEPKIATARSGLPSPLKTPTVTETGPA